MTSEIPFALAVDWDAAALGDVCDPNAGLQTGPFGSQLHADDYVALGIPSIMPQDLVDGQVDERQVARITEEDARRLSRYRVQAGDIVYSRRGDISRRALITKREEGWLCGTGCLRVRVGDDLDPEYLFRYLGHPAVHNWLERHAVGATMPNLNTKILAALPVAVPPQDEQCRIAQILGFFDNKIENNRRIAAMLERIAATLFKARFVDFVDHDDLVESEIGQIPRGWKVEEIGEVLRVVGGSTPSTKEPAYWDGGNHCWVTPKDLSGLDVPIILDTARHITDAGVDRISSGLLPPGTVLMSSRAPVGYTAISLVPVAINQGFIAVPPSREVPSEYTLFWMRANMARIKANASGTTFAEISKRAFRPLPMPVPPKEELDSFKQITEPLISQIAACVRESALLSDIRDALLPRLISGQIRVPPDVELASEAT